MYKVFVALAFLLAASVPSSAQIRSNGNTGTQNGSTFDSIDPNRTDPDLAYGQGSPERDRTHRSGSNGSSSSERGTFDSGPNDPPPPFTPQRENGR
jgi:hypothetical protein